MLIYITDFYLDYYGAIWIMDYEFGLFFAVRNREQIYKAPPVK